MVRIIAKLLVLLFLIALLLAVFAPSFFSTQFGKHALVRFLKHWTGYEIRAKELKFQWMKGQYAENMDIVDKTGRSIFHAESLTTSAPLWKILFFHDMGELSVNSPFVLIDPPPQLAKRLALQQAGFSLSFSLVPSFHLLGEVAITDGTVQFASPGLGPISIEDIQLGATLLPQQIKIQASGKTQEASIQGSFQVHLLAYPGSDQIDASAQISHFPLRAADQMISLLYPEMRGMIREAIGESLDAQLRLKNLQRNLEVYMKASSEHFSADVETKLENGNLVLASPATIHFQIPQKSFLQLIYLEPKDPWTAQIKLDELTIPLQNYRNFTVQGTLKSEAMDFQSWALDPFSVYVSTGQGASGDWNVKIDSSQLQFSGLVHVPETWQQISFNGQALLPKDTRLDISADSLQSISVMIQGDMWRGRFKGSFDPGSQTISLDEPGFLTVKIAQLPSPLPSVLKEPLPIQITMEPCTINLLKQTGSIKGKAIVPPFQLVSSKVDETFFQFTGDIYKKEFQFLMSSRLDNGPLKVDGALFWPFKLNCRGSCQALPIASIQPFFKKGPLLLPLFGETMTTNFQASLSDHLSSFQIQADSPQLSLQANLKTDPQQLQLIEPAKLTWTLTPAGYQALTHWLKGSSLFALIEPALFKGFIDTLILPLQTDLSAEQALNQLQYQGKLATDQLFFAYHQQTQRVNQLSIHLSHVLPSDLHQFQVSALGAHAGTLQSTLSCQGNWTPTGDADLHLLADHFPSATFDLFTAPFGKSPFSLTTLCGPYFNLTLDTTLNQWTGPIKLDLHSVNFRTSLHGAFHQGILNLTDTFHLQLDLTPSLSQMLLKEVNPLSLSSIRSEGPFTLEIAPQGFAYPIFPSDLSKVQIGQGHLELGKLHCQNEGNVQIILGLLKRGQYRPGDELKLWFAPLDFHIKNGILSCERTEILIADHLQVCLWGNVDFPDNSMDSILGLTASCLHNAFGIKNLPENYILQIPMRGTLTDVKINKSKATAKIGALLVWQQQDSTGKAIKGPAGAILGEMINKLGPLPGGDQKAPPPKKPFPWDLEKSDTKSPDKKKISEAKDRKYINPQSSALKQVIKFLR